MSRKLLNKGFDIIFAIHQQGKIIFYFALYTAVP